MAIDQQDFLANQLESLLTAALDEGLDAAERRALLARVSGYTPEDFADAEDEAGFAFCPTGEGGGVDPTCGKGGEGPGPGEQGADKPKSKAAGTRKKDRRGFASKSSGARAKVGSRVNVVGHGEGVVEDRGPDHAWVKLDKDGTVVKVLHGLVEPLGKHDAPFSADDALALAEHYAALFSALPEVPDADLAQADAELAGTGWRLARGGEGWVVEGEDAAFAWEDAEFAQHRAPQGYSAARPLVIAGKSYHGGMFIPASELARATPEQRAEVESARAGHEQALAARAAEAGPADAGALRDRLAPHAAELNASEKARALASWRALQAHHGEHALHRLSELATLAEAGLAKAKGDTPGGRNRRADLGRTLARYHFVAAQQVPPAPPAPPASAKPSHIDIADTAAVARAAVGAGRALPNWQGGAYDPTSSWARHAVPVAALYDALKGRLGGASLDDFKGALLAAHTKGDLELTRNDLPQAAADPAQINRSEISAPGGLATYHLVDAGAGARQPVAPAPQEAAHAPPPPPPAAPAPPAPEAPKAAPAAPAPPTPHFTGEVVDSLGRHYQFVDGKRVAGAGEKPGERIDTATVVGYPTSGGGERPSEGKTMTGTQARFERKHAEPDGQTATVAPSEDPTRLGLEVTIDAGGKRQTFMADRPAPLSADQARQVQKARQAPSDYRSVNGRVVRKAVADFIDRAVREEETRRTTNVPGIEELRKAQDHAGANYDRLMAGADVVDTSPSGSTAAKYPRAALWLKAEARFYSAGDADRMRAAKEAMRLLEEGGDLSAAERALRGA